MRLCSIASGSSGNCIYVGSDTTSLLVDVGISGKKIEEGLRSIDRTTGDCDGILLTHEHSDHIKGLGVISRKEETEFFFIEAAILLEEKYDEICDEVWYIYCEKEVRIERLRHARGYSDEKIRKLMANQLSDDEFEARCDFQLYNDEDVAHTYLQIERKMRTYYESM